MQMTRIFEDGFEAGSLWTGTQVVNGLTPSVTAFPFKGTYSARFLTNPTLLGAKSQLYINTNNLSDVYARAYVYIKPGGISALQTHDRYYLIKLNYQGYQVALVGIRREGTALPHWVLWRLTQFDSTTSPVTYNGSHVYGSTIVDAGDEGRWICIEVHYKAALGLYEVWIDGVLEITQTVASTSLPPITNISLGIQKTGATGTAYDPTGQYTIEVFGDDFVIADSYIGPIIVANPKITVNSSPELNVPVYIDNQLAGNTPMTVELQSGTHTVRVDEVVQR